MKERTRNQLIWECRKGGETYRQIGQTYDIGKERVRQICFNMRRKEERAAKAVGTDIPEMSVRLSNALENGGYMLTEDAAEEWERLKKDFISNPNSFLEIRNFGRRSFDELRSLIGVPEVEESLILEAITALETAVMRKCAYLKLKVRAMISETRKVHD